MFLKRIYDKNCLLHLMRQFRINFLFDDSLQKFYDNMMFSAVAVMRLILFIIYVLFD